MKRIFTMAPGGSIFCAWMLAFAFLYPRITLAQSNPFDASPGANTYFGGFGSFNWVNSWSGFLPTAGTQLFASANGNSFAYPNIGMTKVLGGSMASQTYAVSLNMGYYYASPIVYSHFNQLYIGSANGVMNWVSTPSPSTMNVWYTWAGYFTPAPVDVGQPFNFHMNMTLAAMHSFVMDFNINFAVLMKLGGFKASLEGADAVLRWEVENPSGNMVFKVERSEDGKMFESIGEAWGQGRDFSFHDARASDLDAKVLYYRLCKTDHGDQYQSEIVTLELPKRDGLDFHAWYDASTDALLLEGHRIPVGSKAWVMNGLGQVIWQGQTETTDYKVSLPAGNLGAGVAFVVIQAAGKSHTLKVALGK